MRFMLPGLCFLALLALIVGLINPTWVIRWGNKKTRFHVIFMYGLIALLALVIMDISTTDSLKTSLRTASSSPTVSSSQPPQALSLIRNSDLTLALKHLEFYRDQKTPVELKGFIQGLNQHANITKILLVTSNPEQQLILVLPDSTLQLQEGDEILVKGNLGINLSAEQGGQSFEAPSILAQSIRKA